ncbi:hypothetical protein COT42_04535 [Candidatus Saganbacteria bacterium CG08_land_8_20_14_0_20_45_16]|uniref:DUF5723 domain-containing protein n=1 Tax=Candidatus Saganbacteria bacterium CG08_land_8_20_14_0_20_45_16 TaxID=2014293 RepID=A0A2H0XXT7_UNCSA|nr:MAG: hypothetical protein COT42_04535 [Candidatus Saganbacteria bacterium CG08_land_8_20_14_0_20_45_16]
MKKNIAVIIILCFFAHSALAIYAPRALSMGGAFTAVADDAFAAYYNPAGLAINPGIDLAASYQLNNRNQQIGDNAYALKACFEIGLNPFAWIAGVGLASMFAYDGAKYLANQGIVKKNWGREGEKTKKDESMADQAKAKDEQDRAAGQELERNPISKTQALKTAAKAMAKGTIHITESLAQVAIQEAKLQTRHYYYAPAWYQPHYFRPTYWDNRYDYKEKELTPDGKAQFAGGITIMSDKNSTPAVDQDTNWYAFSLASGWGEIVALGANLNVYDLRISSTDIRGLGAGLDLGGLLRISDKLFFGLAAKELLTTDIKFSNNTITRYEMTVNGGVAIKPMQPILLSADVHNIFGQNSQTPTMHYGVEIKPIYGVALRAGLYDGSKTAGISFGLGQLIVDYTILGGSFNRTQLIGGTWKL